MLYICDLLTNGDVLFVKNICNRNFFSSNPKEHSLLYLKQLLCVQLRHGGTMDLYIGLLIQGHKTGIKWVLGHFCASTD